MTLEEAKKIIKSECYIADLLNLDRTQMVNTALDTVIEAAEEKPRTGRWIFDEILYKHYYCSECKSMGVDYWDYCPNCGADMRGDKE